MSDFIGELGLAGPYIFGAVTLFALVKTLEYWRRLDANRKDDGSAPLSFFAAQSDLDRNSLPQQTISPKFALVISTLFLIAGSLLFVASLMENLA